MALSLLLVTGLSVVVAAEAAGNYATVSRSDPPTASVAAVERVDGGLEVEIVVENTYGSPLRIQYVHLTVSDGERRRSDSVPYAGSVTLTPKRDTVGVFVRERQLNGLDLSEPLTLEGYLAVEVFNDYQLKVRIESSEGAG